MTERLRIDFEGEPDGMRRAVSNALRLREREAGPEPVTAIVKLIVSDQPGSSRTARRQEMAEVELRSDQRVLIDPDFQGRLSGKDVDLQVGFELNDPDSIGTLEMASEDGDASQAYFVPTPGEAGTATVTWTAQNGDEVITDTVVCKVVGEGVVFAGTRVEVSDQPAPETPAA
jgi:hypothetical protein